MKIRYEKTTIDEETFVPYISMRVMVDAEDLIKIINDNGREEASNIIGDMFLNQLGDLIDEIEL